MSRLWSVAAALLILNASQAAAQDYPNKPVTLVVPFAPGGSSEVLARLIGQKLTEAGSSRSLSTTSPARRQHRNGTGAASGRWLHADPRSRGTLAVNRDVHEAAYDPVHGFIRSR